MAPFLDAQFGMIENLLSSNGDTEVFNVNLQKFLAGYAVYCNER